MKKANLLATVLICLCIHSAHAQSIGERMAETVMTIWKDSLYTTPGKPARWTYDQGVILKGIEGLWVRTGQGKYFNYMQQCMDFFVNDKGEIRTYKMSDYNLDNVLCGRILVTLYNVTGKEKYYKAAQTLREQLKTQPRTHEGGFWHKKIYPYQMWLDGLYMAEPFYAAYSATFNEPQNFDDIASQFIWMEKHARDTQTGLLYHGWDESRGQKWANPQTGTSPHFWARAMAWYGMALVDVLEYFPATHSKRDSLVAILKRFADAVQRVQDNRTGLWYDIINMPQGKGNYFESSASSMFVCALAKGVRLGVLPASYGKIARKGYEGILNTFVDTDPVTLQTSLKGTVTVSGLGGNPYRDGSYEYYMSEKVITNDPKGMGAFLQASNEMELLPSLRNTSTKSILLDDYFNAERKKDVVGVIRPYHYKWNEMNNGGLFFLGQVFNRHGVQTGTLSEAPTAKNLAKADVYLIVDADNTADNPTPNYMQEKEAEAISNWVKAGGVLVIFHNDKGNADFEHINILGDKFGIHFNEDSYNRVTGTQFDMGAVLVPKGNAVLPHIQKIYQKEICSITLKAPATAALKKDDLVVFAVARVGKGTVFATGDPWLYNEYTDGRKLPSDYQNFGAANDLVQWIIQQIPTKSGKKKN